jgi:tRNA(Ile)-lysidine synthase
MNARRGLAWAAPPVADLPTAFAGAMASLGPFEAHPRLAIATSGGADSTALALLARDWATGQGGGVQAFIVDHRLRPDSTAEADVTARRLASLSVPATILTLSGLQRGPALAERARIARYAALTAACRAGGFLHLLLGHHAADQAETLAMRVLRDSGNSGLAGMPAVAETRDIRLLRPLLLVPPGILRGFLEARGIAWVEDPSNRDPAALRVRLRDRLTRTDPMCLVAASVMAGCARSASEAAIAASLAAIATIRPEGVALLPRGPIRVETLAALVQTIGGAPYPPAGRTLVLLAAAPRPATLAGVRILESRGRLMLVREEAAMAPPVTARAGVRWDGRMRLLGSLPPGREGITIGALGNAASRFRRASLLPAAALRTLPALWLGQELLAVPHLRHAADVALKRVRFVFEPPRPAAGAAFRPISGWDSPAPAQSSPDRVFSGMSSPTGVQGSASHTM